jgi:hypothetical protein
MTPPVSTAHRSGSPVPAEDSPYWEFYEEVAAAQVAEWMPQRPSRVLDLSGGRSRFAGQLVTAGHDVVHAQPPADTRLEVDRSGDGRLLPVVVDSRSLGWLRDESVDAVLAESRALSMCLATETTAEELLRILRPRWAAAARRRVARAGMARLADQARWAELADVPSADVVLVPVEDGSILRCFWPEELAGLLADVGFEVEWVRPRSVLSASTVERAVAEGGADALRTLVSTEVALAAERQGESTGIHLVASARRPLDG